MTRWARFRATSEICCSTMRYLSEVNCFVLLFSESRFSMFKHLRVGFEIRKKKFQQSRTDNHAFHNEKMLNWTLQAPIWCRTVNYERINWRPLLLSTIFLAPSDRFPDPQGILAFCTRTVIRNRKVGRFAFDGRIVSYIYRRNAAISCLRENWEIVFKFKLLVCYDSVFSAIVRLLFSRNIFFWRSASRNIVVLFFFIKFC
jgi:hypothetical protein